MGLTSVHAHAFCQKDNHYDLICLRNHYQKPSSQWHPPTVDEGVVWLELAPIVIDDKPPTPIAILGRQLFFETALSSDGQVACVNCHDPQHGFSDPRTVPIGVYGRQGSRNSQSLIHLGLSPKSQGFFWVGRVRSLSEQVLMPLTDPNEMDITLQSVTIRLNQKGYLPKFKSVFGETLTAIEIDQVAQALNAYLITLTPVRTRFDEFLLGDSAVLSDSELLGLHVFRTKGRCMNCHFGITMSDDKFHNLNQTLAGRPGQDFGKYAVTGDAADFGKFKTPSLRNLSSSKPWFHHGLFTNLRGVVAIYNAGMTIPSAKNAPAIAHENHLDPFIKPSALNDEEMGTLVDFLMAL